ncbi:UDP-N-acetylmuramyl-tripeptide synthetase [Candidatus Uhrbacteria bacterium]|nr:UDP-N-acetylmuramyl-tripeptide synthetase [Candidatus Uhrbacteria bacterium]
MLKKLVKKILPRGFLTVYHLFLALSASLWYGHPSRKMIVIGITGTKGKSTTAYMLAKILEDAGYKVGLSSTAIFKIAGREWLNATKMTMLGRFALQKMLREMVVAGCSYAIVESSSEGLAQSRHAGIDYDVAVFTNLTPEHIESHGGFENYKKAKGKLFASLKESAKKKVGNGKKIIVANLDDENAEYFLNFWADEQYGYGMKLKAISYKLKAFLAEDVELSPDGSRFKIDGMDINLKLIGRGNVYNALAAITAAASQGIRISVAADVLAEINTIAGRMEFVRAGQNFTVIVDYAHEPESTRQLYETIKLLPRKRLIQVFGSTGGGRDVSRRRILGLLAGENVDIVIVTTDDPYDDDPLLIAKEVAAGAEEAGKKTGENLFVILDRRAAIGKAIQTAAEGDIVLITGKGSEQVMVLAEGRKIPWDDRTIAREEISNLLRV